ncbi:MAG: SDR family oxidoreductase, partial [Gammaproteobacteria bacterium]
EPGPTGGAAEVCDVRDSARVNEVITGVAERFGGVDVLVNNAGIMGEGMIEEIDDETWDRCVDVNVGGVFKMCRAVVPI